MAVFQIINGATTSGVAFSSGHINTGTTFQFIGTFPVTGGASISIQLEGSMDGVNWAPITTSSSIILSNSSGVAGTVVSSLTVNTIAAEHYQIVITPTNSASLTAYVLV